METLIYLLYYPCVLYFQIINVHYGYAGNGLVSSAIGKFYNTYWCNIWPII